MRIGLDGDCLQAVQHLRDGERLAFLLGESESTLSASSDVLNSLTDRALTGLDVVLLTTRVSPVSDAEQRAVRSFVERGGGLVMLSNHGDLPGRNPNDYTRHDRAVAELFGVTIDRAWFRTPKALTWVSGSDLNANHPILSAAGATGRSVESVVFNNSCAVTSTAGDWIVRIPRSAADERGGLSADGRAFAVAVPIRSGRVVVMADSGFIGSPGTQAPGPGLLDRGSNCLFVTNAIRWAAGLL